MVVGFPVGAIDVAAAAPEAAASFSIAACFAAACFAIAACIAAACFAIAACFAMAACFKATVMTAPTAERTKHDLSWRSVESLLWHGLASAGVETAVETPSAAMVAQAKRKARFVSIGCLY